MNDAICATERDPAADASRSEHPQTVQPVTTGVLLDLRNPLHAVIGFAEILELDGVRHEALAQVRANSQQLLLVLDQLTSAVEAAGHADEQNLPASAAPLATSTGR